MLTHLSHSTAEDFFTCSEKVRLRKVERVPMRPGWALVGGSHVHEVTENLDTQDFGWILDEDSPTSFADSWERAVSEKEEESGYPRADWTVSGRSSKAYPDKEGYRFWLDNGDQFVNNWRRFLENSAYQVWIDPDGNPAIEIELDGEVGGVPIKGYVDRVLEDTRTGQLVIVDIKSGASRPKSTKQLVLYRNLLSRVWPDHQIRYGAYYMVRDGVLTDPVDVQALDDGRLEWMYQKAWKGITDGLFVPVSNVLCGSCSVRDYCYEYGGSEAALYLPYDKKDVA